MTDFRKFAATVRQHFEAMSTGELFVVDLSGDALYEIYLDAYPAGMNEIFRTRREFDCSADKNFIRNIGNVVTIVDNKLVTVWDVVSEVEHPFDVVCDTLAEKVRNSAIKTVFRTKELSYGAELIRENLEQGGTHNWYNFNAKIDKRHHTLKPEEARGILNTKAQVFQRGLDELTTSAVVTVKDLINDDMIYRGAEHKKKVEDFAALHAEYQKLNSDVARSIFVWSNVSSYVATFRNEVIGSLVIDLSEGRDMESAVKAFESKVAPSNYKRSKSLITPKMIEDAVKTINDLGLEAALERRMARISDVTVNNVLFVDNSVRGSMKGGLEGLLLSTVKAPTVKVDKAEDITIDNFLTNIVPNLRNGSIDVLVKNAHQGNFMTLTAPVNDEVERLFKWDNNFAWSYDGNVTDSGIKEKVARAGGNVTNAELRISLAWYNYDDLDIHVVEPSGNEVCFSNKGGKLDVDMNAGGRNSRDPVENVSYTKDNIRDGVYKVYVNQFSRREAIDVGFAIEVESANQLHNFTYRNAVSGRKLSITLTVKNGLVESIVPAKDIDGIAMSKEKWGVATETLVPVDTIILSPNYWDEQHETGNKHWFFILKNCKNPESCRGIYNEFLRGDLDKHRKVFEILGDKTKCQPTNDQLSGVGFSSTKRDVLTAVVKSANNFQKTYNINF
jgi:uncharacterized protein YfaP (DUF2135 family)